MTDYEQRFGGIGRLYSAQGLGRLSCAHVCIVGIGGVGSWVVEALARSGVGALTLIDLDEVCVTNVNRQLPALDGEIGKPKVDVMAQRAKAINPNCDVRTVFAFFTDKNADEILAPGFSCVVDAIDGVWHKCVLIASCQKKGIPIVTVGGAGGRRDPTAIRVADLSQTTHDPLLQQVRKTLRKEFGYSSDSRKPFNVDCVYSPEPIRYPHSDGSVCEQPEEGSSLRLNCESGYGTASFVTGAFGFAAAALTVRKIAGE